MALIGDMQYLTIGSKTYRIASSSLPIASASTLGGIKVGTGLAIDSTTGVLSATGTSVTIDNALSDSSTNPVQNKVIKTALDNKIEQAVFYVTITGDATNGYEADKTFIEVETAYNAGYAIFALNSTSVFPLTLKASAGMNFTRYAGSTGKQITWTKSSNAITITSFSLAMDNEIPTNSNIVDLIYPIGSIYMSVNSTSPATLFGGTWTQIEDTFLLAAGSTYTAGDTGGSATESYTPAGSVIGKAISLANAGIKAASAEATGYGAATGGGFKNRLVVLNTTSATTHNHTFSGTAKTLNTMPPYLTVYMWQRTA